jgi:16S rRNA U516 pseudouridylate synthase RsuA-like enzyme
MPAKSKKQFRKMFVLHDRGQITQEELDDFTHGVNYKKLPMRKAKKKVARKKRRGGSK